jgi:hypothetical protein
MTIDAQKLLEKGMKYQDWELIEEAQALLAAQNGGKPPKDILLSPKIDKGGQNPPNTSDKRPTPPQGSGGDEVLEKGRELQKQHEHPNGEFGMDIRGNKGDRTREEGGRYMRTEPINTDKVAAFNMFEDDGTDNVQDTKAAQAAASDGKTLYTGRSRVQRKPPAKLIEVECSIKDDKGVETGCNKKFKVAATHVRRIDGESRYTCEKCIINKGRRHRM